MILRHFLLGALALSWLGTPFRSTTIAGNAPLRQNQASGIVFSDGQVRTLRLEVTPRSLNQLQRYDRNYVRATVREGTNVFREVGIHLKGMGSFRPLEQKPSFTLKFDEFLPDQNYYGLNKVMLNNSVQDSSYLCEYLATRLFRDAGVPAARVTHVRVELNGRDLGLYLFIEGMNKRFLKQHFNDASGNLYEAYLGDVDQRMDQDNGDDLSQSDRLRLFAATQVKDPKVRWEELQRVLDVDRFASFLAMEMLLAHWDGYGLHTNNYRIYHDPRTDRMVFIAHGLDGVFKRSHVSVKPPLRSVVGRAFLQTPAGQAFYQRRLETLFTNVFRPDVLTNRLQVAVDHLRRGGLKPAEVAAVEKSAEALEKRMLARLESVRSQLAGVPPSLLEFNAQGVAFLSGWREERDIGDPKMEITRNEVRSLRIQAIDGEETVASWRTSVYLRQGWYRFEGRVSTQNLVSRMGRGAALRISGEQRVPVLAGTTSWQPMVYAFRVAEDSDVELVCEVRATVGEALFDLGSLRLKAGANHAAGTASE